MRRTSLLIHVQRWLTQPHVWRFIGFASTVVALLCYALSSSFNHLFGDWNFWKICLYSVLSSIFCIAILSAKVWQHSNSIRLKAHMAFLVLTVTSVYSFFYDKVVNEKPDAYSLISCAAFAVMSLSLSRQSHFGFEVDLLYFFLGALIVQLMKIKLLFGFIGACFGYSLIILRSSLIAALKSGYLGLQDQHHVTVQVDSHSQEANFDIAVIMPQLTACMESFETNNWKLIDMLSMHVGGYIKAHDDLNNKDLIPIDNNLVIDALQWEIIDELSKVVKVMVDSGFEKQCCNVYSSCRSDFLHQFLMGLELLPVDIEDVINMDRTYLGFHIEIWTKGINIATRILFPNEKRLSECVFLGFPSAAVLAFMEVCREITISLLNFANFFAVGSSAPNLLPVIPKVFGTLHDLIPEFESLFSEPPPNDSLKNEAINTCKRLEKATKGIFTEFENRICHDRAMADFPGGLYPISRDVMYFLGGVSEARIFLEKLCQENPLAADSEGTSSSFSMQIAKVMEFVR